MKSKQRVNANPELKIPYVRLERLKLEDNNDYTSVKLKFFYLFIKKMYSFVFHL